MHNHTWQYQCKRTANVILTVTILLLGAAGASHAVPVPASAPGMPVLAELDTQRLAGKAVYRASGAVGLTEADNALDALHRQQRRSPAHAPTGQQ